MKSNFSKVHAYLLAAIMLTIVVDLSGLLTSLKYDVYRVSYKSDGVVVREKVDFESGGIVRKALWSAVAATPLLVGIVLTSNLHELTLILLRMRPKILTTGIFTTEIREEGTVPA